jgi:flagellar biosynthesis protein FlhA
MSEMKYKYLVALSESTTAEDLEMLLNEKASDGWELFMLHEVDNRMGKTQYNCIFYKVEEDTGTSGGENVEIKDIKDFKKRIEKLYNAQNPQDEYLSLHKKLVGKQQEIKKIKESLEKAFDEKERQNLNNRIQEELNELEKLNKELALISNAYNFFERIKFDKITIHLSDELIDLAEKENEDNLVARIIKLREELVDKLGFVIPNIHYTDDANLEANQYRIDIREVPAATGFIYPEHKMFFKGQANLTRKPKNAIAAVHPVYLFDVFWVNEAETKDYWEKGMSACDVLAMHLAYTCIKYAPELLDYKDINRYIEIVRKEDFELAENVIPDVVSPGDLRYILSNLIRENVSIKDITCIFERLMDLYQYAAEKEVLLEKLRICLKRAICYSRVDEANSIDAITIDPDLDKYFRDNLIIPDHSNPFISLPKEEMEALMQQTASMIEKESARIENTVVICSNTTRQPLFALYEEFIPGLGIISHEEISNEIDIDEIGTLMKKHIFNPKK